ncbi:four helix bundle protein [Candidatus Atribacteria bacterium 1244-E10-H5-B2]|nr:MAG: four helix bundle protein [Candidatus Atribacteria bacterium 1244-E10-H5-B2]
MSTVRSFEELTIWQEARELTNRIYILSKRFPKEELYGLTSQIRRASVSIMSNIAEGFNRRSTKEFINFLIISRASISEVQNDLYISLDLNYINKEDFETIYNHAQKISMSINKLITYLRSQVKTYPKATKINEQIQQYL